ncbi:rho-related GTP-binding protein RhoG-like protein [Flagelloscypha sp. PMI_526]|nr:rho-related GTP-binding protein RhoG-like protein [Flagelloscypha sp. PMI_526]
MSCFMTDTIKAIFVGDTGIGKVCLLLQMAGCGFPREYLPPVAYVDHYHIPAVEPGITIICNRAPAYEDDNRLRHLNYSAGIHVFVLCFSVVNPNSYDRIVDQWEPEVRQHASTSNYKILLVGTQSDLAMDEEYVEELRHSHVAPVNRNQGVALANAIGAFGYVETSALNYQGVEEVKKHIELAFRHESHSSKRKQSKCSIM